MSAATLHRYLPVMAWLPRYGRADLSGDLMAGLIVAIMLVPQGMAYALLAGLPPQVGLYASILPLILYSLFGSSRTLSVGPVAIVSLMAASALGAVAEAGTATYVEAALALALLSGAMLIAVGVARLGFLVSFLSHPVISGFTSAAALVIGLSQLEHLLGLDIPGSHRVTDTIAHAAAHFGDIDIATASLGLASVALLVLWRGPLAGLLARLGVGEAVIGPATKAGPLVVVILTAMAVWAFALDDNAGVAVVGAIPAGLPPLTVPAFDRALLRELLPVAALISVVGFVESVSVAKALAGKRRQKIEADQELVALGAANLGAAFTGGYPVTGSFSRSIVNFTAGAVTPLASIITATLIAITVVMFTPLFDHLPKAALAAVIVVAVAGLIDVRTFRVAWTYNKADAVSLAATFVAVLAAGVELGIIFGVALSLALYLWRTSQPHIAIVGRLGDSEQYRNVERYEVRTWSHVLAIRVDESLYFANAGCLEDRLLTEVADDRRIEHVVLICSAINFIDASALDSLENVAEELRDAGVTLHLAEVKGPVMDQLHRTDFLERLTPGAIHDSTHEAMTALRCV